MVSMVSTPEMHGVCSLQQSLDLDGQSHHLSLSSVSSFSTPPGHCHHPCHPSATLDWYCYGHASYDGPHLHDPDPFVPGFCSCSLNGSYASPYPYLAYPALSPLSPFLGPSPGHSPFHPAADGDPFPSPCLYPYPFHALSLVLGRSLCP